MDTCTKCGGRLIMETLDTSTTLELDQDLKRYKWDRQTDAATMWLVTLTIEQVRCLNCGKRADGAHRRAVEKRPLHPAHPLAGREAVSLLPHVAARRRQQTPASGVDGDV